MLAFAAREADVVGVTSKATAAGAVDLGDRTRGRLIKRYSIREVSGERRLHIELNTLVQQVLVTDHRRQGAEQVLADYASWPSDLVVNVPSSAEEILEAPYCLIGTVAQIVEQLQERRERVLAARHRAWTICRGAGPGRGAAGRHLIRAYSWRHPSEVSSQNEAAAGVGLNRATVSVNRCTKAASPIGSDREPQSCRVCTPTGVL